MSTILGRFSEYLNMDAFEGRNLPDREEAIEIYLNQGGLLKVDDSNGERPELIYPGVERVNKQLKSANKKKKFLKKEIMNLQKKKKEKADEGLKSLKKAFDPLYWEHLYKKKTDEDYKKAYEEIQPPIEKINDPDWRNMINMFVKEPEYRERLIEAARSEISKGKGTIKEEMHKREQFSREVIDKRIDKLRKKLENYEEKRKALKVLLKWAKK